MEFKVDGEVHSCAYYASRAVIAIVQRFLDENYDRIFSDGMSHLDQVAADLRLEIKKDLRKYSEETGINFKGRKSGGSMVKLLPTTLAACVYADRGESVDVVCIWAGDSRCYSLGTDGMHQLTDDDARGYVNAMECLIQDAVMNNVICLDHDFRINWKAYSIPKPCFVFSASDGCFAYLDSPMSFESVFLPRTGKEFVLVDSITASLEAHENDDRTLAGHMFGISSQEEYNEIFRSRGDLIESEYVSKMVLTERIDELRALRNRMGSRDLSDEEKEQYAKIKAELKDLRKQNEDLMRSLWEPYSKGYLLPALKPEQVPVVVVEEPPEPEKEEEKKAEAKPEPISEEKWILPKKMSLSTGVALIAPYALRKEFVFETMESRSVEGYTVFDDWFFSGDSMSTICGKGAEARNVRRLFVKESEEYDRIRDERVVPAIMKLDADGCLMLPSETAFGSRTYIQTFSCSQANTIDIGSVRWCDKDVKERLLLRLSMAVKALHDAGIVHGAISPQCLIVIPMRSGILRPALCNYCDAFFAEDADKLTRLDPSERGPWYDVYCLGLMFYRLHVKNAQADDIAVDVNRYRKGTGRRWIMDLISRMIDGDPGRRPSIDEVVEQLRYHIE